MTRTVSAYGGRGPRDVGYDNERRNCDHRQIDHAEEPRIFTTPEALIEDVMADVERLRGEL